MGGPTRRHERRSGRAPAVALSSAGLPTAGKNLRQLIGPEGRVFFYCSPYMRTVQTLLCIGQSIEPSRIAGVREEPDIREQDFGETRNPEP